MNIADFFPQSRSLAGSLPIAKPAPAALAEAFPTTVAPPKVRPGEFAVNWPKLPVQQPKDYQVIRTAADLIAYCKRCQETGLGGFDYETAADARNRQYYEGELARLSAILETHQKNVRDTEAAIAASMTAKRPPAERKPLKDALAGYKADLKPAEAELKRVTKEYESTPLNPWRSEVVAFSLSAASHEARAVFLDLRPGANLFESNLPREKARALAFEILDDHFYRSARIMKIAVNLSFESAFTAKYGKYVLMPVADPFIAWVRILQVACPHKIKHAKTPWAGKGLKSMTKEYLGVTMTSYDALLAKHKARFFSDLSPDHDDAINYSCEDSDYAVQHYLYWMEVAKQIPGKDDGPTYYEWLHEIEMPFMRVIGLMEWHGMGWDTNLAGVKEEEAAIMQEQAAEKIKALAKEHFGLDLNPGKNGRTGDMLHLVFDVMKLPATAWGKEGPSLDEEAKLDMKFLLENKLESLDEEKYLAVELPTDWESRDPDTDPYLDKAERMAIRIRRRQPHQHRDVGIKVLDLLQEIQTYSTLLSSHIIGRAKYLNEISGRIHARYGVWTETGRCNCFEPNGQNVPRLDNDVFKIRNFYVPAPGKILFFIDFSGFELRLMAWRSGDETMIEIFKTPGGDIHRRTASEIADKPESEITKKERQDAKPANFGIAYGGTEHALQTTIKTDYGQRKSLDECLVYVNAVKRAYPRIPEYQRNIALQAREDGFVRTIYGYTRLLSHINSAAKSARETDERRAANTPIQGSAADIMKKCQNAVYDKIGAGDGPLRHGVTDMIGQIHDEIIFEMDDDPHVVERAAAWVKALMEQPPLPGFPLPIEAEASVGYRWGEKQPVEKWIEAKRGRESA